jgi:RNA polymerase sigma factor (sigma-70 family)
MAGQDEQAQIEQALAGDVNAFNALVLAYQDQVYSVTYRIMGERASAADATQEAFISAFRKLETYRGGSFKSWLLRIATNTCYDTLRYHKRRPAIAFDDMVSEDYDDGPPIPDKALTPEQAAQNTELSAAIQGCIRDLGDDQRVVLVMSDVEGYSYQEIADTVGAQLGTIKSRLSRARTAVRRCLQAFQELLPSEYRLGNDD